MEKIQLQVIGLSASPASSSAYALILKEIDGDRRLPIIIGAFEAQAIALEMEGLTPPRPMTHDLIKNLIDSFGANMSEVFINDLVDGTFYAKLVFDSMGIEIDARPSDAVALAVRCNCPIFVNNEVLDDTGITPQPGESDIPNPAAESEIYGKVDDPMKRDKSTSRLQQLQQQLEKAIKDENYELAAKLRDDLKKITESS